MLASRSHLRIAARSLIRAPGFAATAIVTLALGIGLSTAVFTVANALLLRRLPVVDQERIVLLWGEKRGDNAIRYPLSDERARLFASQAKTLSQIAFTTYEGNWPRPVRDGDHVSHYKQAVVTGNYFTTLGARALLGRALRPSDDALGAARVAVLSYGAWQRRFGGRPDIVGQRIIAYEDDLAFTIVGVMPQGIDYPRGADMWTAMHASVPETTLQYMALNVVGRLAPGATEANAREELTAFYHRPGSLAIEQQLRAESQTLPIMIVGDTKPALFAFAAAAGLLLLITCINVANLLLVRGLARTREIAVRSALGGSRLVVAFQLLTENALLAIAGGMLGVGFAAAAVRLFIAFAPAGTPRLNEIHLDASTLIGAIAITAVAMLVFALAPALLTSRVDTQEMLRAGTRRQGTRRSRLATEILVVAQVTFAMLVLSAAGLIARSLVALERADLAFDPSRVLVADLAIRTDQFNDVPKQRALIERVVARVAATPGVAAVAPVVSAPFAGGWDGQFTGETQSPAEAAANPMVDMGVVTPAFFDVFALRPIAGRVLTADDRDGATRVVVISQSAARHYWPNGDALGKRLLLGDVTKKVTVVGVVPDVRYRDLRDARPSVYFPMAQPTFPFVPTVLAIRTSGDPAAVIASIRAAVGQADPGVAVAGVAPFESFLTEPLAQPRVNALLLAIFAIAALVLSAVGLTSVMMTMVRQRTREFGIRIALGATATGLGRMVVARGLWIVGAGIVVGVVGAIGANRFLVSMLYDVSPTDSVTLLTAGAVLLATTGMASAIPARTASRLDPVDALRAGG
jgi:predicted permease